MKLKTIKSAKLKNKKVLLRVDCNVPLKSGKIADDTRIKSVLPTIKYLLNKNCPVIILNHLGRPKAMEPALSNQAVASRLSKLLNKKVDFVNEVSGEKAKKAADELKLGQILMLENTRFDPREKENSNSLAKDWSEMADLFVNDGFAVSHRAEASVTAIANYLPSYAGLLLESEVINLLKVFQSKARPKIAIIGGAKLETKVKVIKNLLKKMDYVLLGGAIANNVLKAMDYEVGSSLVDDSQLKVAESIISNKLRLPVDAVVAQKISPSSKSTVKAVGQVGKKDIILDIGPDSIGLYSEIIKSAKLIVWNGPLGYFEIARYKKSSQRVAKAVASSKAFSLVGGGETVQLINSLGLADQFGFVSTGGGAMLEFLEGRQLPGLKPLMKK